MIRTANSPDQQIRFAASLQNEGTNTEPPEHASPSRETDRLLFPGFVSKVLKVNDVSINTVVGGNGPALLLLHGYPQTHVAWHKIAGSLAQKFTVVLTDLRGYGDSGKPAGGERHVNYSPRTVAQEQVEVMEQLGFSRFYVAGHDRGGRVAHRMALDHPGRIAKLAVLDIAPTLTMYRKTDQQFATKYVWWFFQIQPYPIPEHMIGLDPEFYLRSHLEHQCKTARAITDAAISEYLRCYCNATTIHATCEDYRAAADIGLEQDAEDERSGRKVEPPLLALWGGKGTVGQLYDVLATWREKAIDVKGRSLDCGHLLPEEKPEEVLDELAAFFQT